jgi:hypothetical protein
MCRLAHLWLSLRTLTPLCLFHLTDKQLDLFLGKVGRDKSGHVFLTEACRMSEELGLFSEHSSYAEHNSPSVPERKWDVVRAVTAWALFNFQLYASTLAADLLSDLTQIRNMSFTYSFPVIIQSVPAVAMPYQHKPDAEGKLGMQLDIRIALMIYSTIPFR